MAITRCQQKKLDNHEYVFSIFDMTTWVQKSYVLHVCCKLEHKVIVCDTLIHIWSICYYIYMSPNFKVLTSNNCERGYA